jgi:hypothetical protein
MNLMWFNVEHYHNTHSTQYRCTHYTLLSTARCFQSVFNSVTPWCVILFSTNSSPLVHPPVHFPPERHQSRHPAPRRDFLVKCGLYVSSCSGVVFCYLLENSSIDTVPVTVQYICLVVMETCHHDRPSMCCRVRTTTNLIVAEPESIIPLRNVAFRRGRASFCPSIPLPWLFSRCFFIHPIPATCPANHSLHCHSIATIGDTVPRYVTVEVTHTSVLYAHTFPRFLEDSTLRDRKGQELTENYKNIPVRTCAGKQLVGKYLSSRFYLEFERKSLLLRILTDNI